jgi:hypothetical protein
MKIKEKQKPFSDKGNIKVSRNSHETSSREVTHAENLTNKSGTTTTTFTIGIESRYSNRFSRRTS